MYDWPEARAATDAVLTGLRRTVPELPARLTRPAGAEALAALWREPGLMLAQCCWGPLRLGLDAWLRVLAQPDYSDVPGGRGPCYRSAVVARDGAACPVPAGTGAALPAGLLAGRRLAVNGRDSLSGWIALADDLGDDPATLAASVQQTGSHRASVRAVAAGDADIAAIDCRSWALACAHEPAAGALRVIGWTAERPGLPYVTSRHTRSETAARLRRALVAAGCHAPAETD